MPAKIRQTISLENKARLEIFVSLAVVASIAVMALETFALSARLRDAVFIADVSLSLIFLVEYLLRIVTAENKRAYVTSFYGIIDFIALLPILFHVADSVRVLRLLRVMRVLRLLKVTRYTEALNRFKEALKSITAEAMLFTGVGFIFSVCFAFMIYEVEHEAQPEVYRNILDSIWWSVVSLVGYGDVYPVTAAGRILTMAMLLTGTGIIAVPTALLASALSQVHNDESKVS